MLMLCLVWLSSTLCVAETPKLAQCSRTTHWTTTLADTLPAAFPAILVPAALSCNVCPRNAKTGAVQQDHPLDNYFRELMRRRRKELLRKKKAALKTLQVGKVYEI